MVVESWITPEETPALAAQARAVIDTHLARLSETQRGAYWASIRKAYNTPYNPPVKAAKTVEVAVEVASVTVELVDTALPEAVTAPAALAQAALTQTGVAAEVHAA